MRIRVLSIFAIICVFAALSIAGQMGTAKPFANPAALKEKAPDVFKANFDTSKGVFVIEVHRAWAPNGADRFYNLVKSGFFDDIRFYRVVPNFMVQFGIHGDPAINQAWARASIPDDPVKESNRRSYVTFAHAGPNTRTTQLFINFGDNGSALDRQGFPPIGRVISGMNIVDKLYGGYGDLAEQGGHGPSQQQARMQGNAYLMKSFAKLDYIKKATIVE
jgi:peptidyl-prolyl cis-trans isomerase A (cyclophilin A)